MSTPPSSAGSPPNKDRGYWLSSVAATLPLIISRRVSVRSIMSEFFSDHVVGERFALRTREIAVCFPVIHELFGLRIPLQFSPESNGNHTQMTDRNGAMADLRLADRLPAGPNTIEEVAHVIVAHIKLNLFVLEWL